MHTDSRREHVGSVPSPGGRRGVVLVLGGTGMLLPAVSHLLDEGEAVVVVARHASRAMAGLDGNVYPVDANWSYPDVYAARCAEAVSRREVLGVIMWVHQPHRDAITRGIEPLLSAKTRVVRLWGSGNGDPRVRALTAYQPQTGDLCEVYLGSTVGAHGRSWLTHDQISQSALFALRSTTQEHIVGDLITS